jgi:hypothetical protein
MVCATSAIQELNSTNSFLIYPVPAENFISIENISASQTKNTLSIYNMQGQLILRQALPKEKNMIDISAFENGLYVVKVESDNSIVVKKFVKK